MKLLTQYKSIFLYGFILALLIFILKWLQWKLVIVDNSTDIYTGLIAVFFTALGAWVAWQFNQPGNKKVLVQKEVIVSPPSPFSRNEQALKKLELSAREYEILQLLAQGLSNAEIASRLFLSVSTIKTHVSNLYFKMEVRSRTQAIGKAQKLRIIE